VIKDMKKKTKISLIIILVLAVAVIAWLATKTASRTALEPVIESADEYDPNLPLGSVMEPQAVLEPEFMSGEEKATLGLEKYDRVQVLKRDETGKASAYKVIKSDEDIITEFYSPKQVSEIRGAVASSSPVVNQ
jgi:hypothetical protein